MVETWAFCPRAFVALWSLQLTPHARFHTWPVPWAIVNVSLGPGEAPFSAGPFVGPGDPECMTGSRGNEVERYEGKEKEVHCEASPPWPQAVAGSGVPKGRHLVPCPEVAESYVWVAQGPDTGKSGSRAESCSGSQDARRPGCGPGSRGEAHRWVAEEAPLTGDGQSRNARLRTASPAFSLWSAL